MAEAIGEVRSGGREVDLDGRSASSIASNERPGSGGRVACTNYKQWLCFHAKNVIQL